MFTQPYFPSYDWNFHPTLLSTFKMKYTPGEKFEGGYHIERNPITGAARLVHPPSPPRGIVLLMLSFLSTTGALAAMMRHYWSNKAIFFEIFIPTAKSQIVAPNRYSMINATRSKVCHEKHVTHATNKQMQKWNKCCNQCSQAGNVITNICNTTWCSASTSLGCMWWCHFYFETNANNFYAVWLAAAAGPTMKISPVTLLNCWVQLPMSSFILLTPDFAQAKILLNSRFFVTPMQSRLLLSVAGPTMKCGSYFFLCPAYPHTT